MASLYRRGNKWWCRLKDERGNWISKSTPYAADDRRRAMRYAVAAQRAIDERRAAGHERGPAFAETVRQYIAAWLERRRETGHDWKKDKGRVTKHVLPPIGDMLLVNVRTVHIADLVRRLRFHSQPKLAQRTVRNIYSVVGAVFRDAAVDGLIDTTPCILTDAQLGPVVDKDPEWRSGALFTRDEAVTLVSDERIPFDRRLVYAFGLLVGLRPGETSALRWRHYDPSDQPLGRLRVETAYNSQRNLVKGTKTETTKSVPVHPTLAAMLAEWRLSGWIAMVGRQPQPDDLIVPLPPDDARSRTRRADGEPFRSYDYSNRRCRETDLPTLGLRHRRFYDTRATFITLAIEDGADPAIIRDRVTHTKPKRTAFDLYDRGEHWEATCREIAKLRIVRRHGRTDLATVA